MKPEGDGLPRLNTSVPPQIGRSVRIRTGNSRVPTAGETVSGISPTHIPAIDRTCALVGNFDVGRSSATPSISY